MLLTAKASAIIYLKKNFRENNSTVKNSERNGQTGKVQPIITGH
jgi:hypothetical protein